MPDSKISDLTAVTTLDGTEELPIVQSATTMKVTTQQLGGNVLFNGVVNDVITGADAVDTFDLGTTVNVPTMAIGDKIQVQMTFKNNVAPASGGYGIYFFWYNEDYTPYSASTPTYGNSIIQIPYTKDYSIVNIEVTKLSATDVYIVFDQKLNSVIPTPGDTYENGVAWQYQDTLDIDAATYFEVQAFATTGGQLELEYLYIKHTK